MFWLLFQNKVSHWNEFYILRISLNTFLLFFRKSLDLIESLLRLAEVGQYEQVKQLFSFPIKHCPDMLVLALLQINTSWHTLRHELISTLMPIFLGNHPNSAIILHYAWHGQVRHVCLFCLDLNNWNSCQPKTLVVHLNCVCFWRNYTVKKQTCFIF